MSEILRDASEILPEVSQDTVNTECPEAWGAARQKNTPAKQQPQPIIYRAKKKKKPALAVFIGSMGGVGYR